MNVTLPPCSGHQHLPASRSEHGGSRLHAAEPYPQHPYPYPQQQGAVTSPGGQRPSCPEANPLYQHHTHASFAGGAGSPVAVGPPAPVQVRLWGAGGGGGGACLPERLPEDEATPRHAAGLAGGTTDEQPEDEDGGGVIMALSSEADAGPAASQRPSGSRLRSSNSRAGKSRRWLPIGRQSSTKSVGGGGGGGGGGVGVGIGCGVLASGVLARLPIPLSLSRRRLSNPGGVGVGSAGASKTDMAGQVQLFRCG